MEFQALHKGVDSLYLSFWGDVREGLLEELGNKKRLAQSEDHKDQVQAVKVIRDHIFEVKDKGAGMHSYVIVDNWFHIKISASRKKLLPTIYVQVSSELLNCSGIDYSIEQIRLVVNELLVSIEKESVSRADIFVDFITDTDFEAVSRESWVTRADQKHKYWSGNVFTGWSIGRGGQISARLYDKTTEIEVSEKVFFKEIWVKQGWQEGQTVWRLEFQLKRLYLGQYSISSIADVLNSINDLWKSCTQEWLRLAMQGEDENRSRWEISPVWLDIQQVVFGDGSFSGIKKKVNKSRVPNEERLFINGLGYIISYAAMHGYDNLMHAAKSFLIAAFTYLDVTAKESSKFEDSADYIKQKLNLKKRKYNKPIDEEVPF